MLLGEWQIIGHFIPLEILAVKEIMYLFPIEINAICAIKILYKRRNIGYLFFSGLVS